MRASLLLTCFAVTALAKPLEGVPTTGAAAADFAPKGWVVETSLEGDLNGDKTPDLVVVLIQQGDGDRSRALLWLHGAAKGYTLVDSNVGLVACFSCLGMKGGDAKPELEIKKKVLVVTQWGGSRESYGAVHRFRLEKGVVRLIGVDHSELDTLTGAGTTTSANLLTGVTIVELTPAERDENDQPTNAKPKKTTTKKKPAPLPAFNTVKEYGE
ncbi:MAG: hypothetical protein JNM69_03535 [Archangium sp.]|nr:hypothetical protein [Archangium sp.]